MKLALKAVQAACVLTLAVGSMQAFAADPALIKGDGKQISAADLTADAERIPEGQREQILVKSNTVQEIATNLYVRRVMAERGKSAALDKQPETAAAVQIAIDKILSDAYLVKFNKDHMPSDQVLDAQAKAKYQAKKSDYALPEKVHAAHILIAGTGPLADEKAQRVQAELKAGADFAEVAKKESDDPGSAQRGGDLGFFERGRMVPDFEKAVFDMKKPGEVSGLVKSQFGQHIIKLIEKEPAKPQSYDEVKDKIKAQIAEEMLQKERAAVVKKVTEGMTVNQPAIEAYSKQYEKK